jgi:site-specific DNA recombinase
MHAVIYARFSTDKQRETSIEDQARVCRARIDAEGWTFAGLYSDIETSGRSIISERPGAAGMLAAVAAGGVDIVVLESLDRLARDLVEQETQVRRLEHRGLRIIGLADGYDTQLAGRELMRAVRGAINEGYIRDLSHKTHRGLTGQVERGYHAGGISYGYRSIVAGVDSHGEPIGHKLEVDETQAHWVRWIFAQYADGMSCQKIAAHLNHLHVPGPRGGTWCVSALFGSPAKGSGVLNNEIYVGRYIWNRSRWQKDPDTRKRARLVRPKSEWQIAERPELRILDDAAWQRVRDRMDKPQRQGGAAGRGRPARTLFGGLLRCGTCGGAVIAVSATAYGCAAAKDRGRDVCTGLYVPRQALDVRLLGLVRDEMLAPISIASVRRSLNAALTRKDRQGSRDAAQKRLRDVQREIANLAEAIAITGLSDALRMRLATAEAEQKHLQRKLAPIAAAKPTVDELMGGYKKLLMELSEALKGDTERARPLMRQVLGEVTMIKEGKAIYAEIAPAEQRLLLAAGGDISKSGCGDRI